MKVQHNIKLLYLISLFQGMVFYGPIATLYRQSVGVSVFQITLIESISLILCVILELPWGIVADKIGYRKTMVGCCLLYVLSKVVFWRAEGFADFLIERIMLSVVCSGLSGCDVSLLYLSCEKKESQKVFGIYNYLNTVGILFASLIYSVIVKDQYRLAGLLTVISYGAAAILSLGLVDVKEVDKESGKRVSEFKGIVLKILKDPKFLLFLIGISLLNETHQTITVFLNQLQYTKSGMLPSSMGYVYIGITIVGLLGVRSSYYTKKLGIKRLTICLYMLAACACIVLAVTRSQIWSVASIAMLRLSFCLFAPLQTELQNRVITTANRATALSVNAMIIECVGSTTNIMFGKAAQSSLSAAMVLGAIFCILGCIWVINWYRDSHIVN